MRKEMWWKEGRKDWGEVNYSNADYLHIPFWPVADHFIDMPCIFDGDEQASETGYKSMKHSLFLIDTSDAKQTHFLTTPDTYTHNMRKPVIESDWGRVEFRG